MISVNTSSPLPPFEQIRAQIADQILVGALTNGQRLPAIRQVAADLGVAPGTVARAYAELEEAGLIETRRGGGSRVSTEADNFPDVLDSAIEFADRAREHGLTLDQATRSLQSAWGVPRPPD